MSTDPAIDLTGNPFAEESTLPYQLPDFTAIRDDHYLPAIRAGIEEARDAYRAIAANAAGADSAHAAGTDGVGSEDGAAGDDATSPAPATFDELLPVLGTASPMLQRAANAYFNIASSDGTDERLAIEGEIVGLLAELDNELKLNPAIFSRLDHLHSRRHDLGLTDEQVRMIEKAHLDFTLSGAALSDEDRSTLAALNMEIAEKQTRFSQQVTKDMNAGGVLVDSAEELAGLSEEQIASAKKDAEDAGHAGKYQLTLFFPTEQPQMASLTNREVRERLHTASVERGGANWALAAEIAALRARKAALLGFDDFASLAVADRTAGTPEAVEDLFAKLVTPAMANADREAERIAARAVKDGIDELKPWDWSFYSDRISSEEYAVDPAELRPFFTLDRVLEDGVFYAAERVYGLTFEPRPDLVGYHPEVRIWEVFDRDHSPIGLFLGDFFTRPTKRGGAWMNPLVQQSRVNGTKPVIVNNLNITPPAEGAPAYVSQDELRTLFHEFGHALHGLLSDVEYPSVAGTSVERDIVEYPSQVNEMWIYHPEILPNYARHIDTGEVVPQELIDKLKAAEQWGEGFGTVEYLRAAVLDWDWHRLPASLDAEPVGDPVAFEAESQAKAGLAHPLVESRYRTSYLNHSFSGGYASGYYSYIWAEVFDADTVAWYGENGGLTQANGDAFREHILAVGGTRPIPDAFAAMTGRTAQVEPLLKRRGLA